MASLQLGLRISVTLQARVHDRTDTRPGLPLPAAASRHHSPLQLGHRTKVERSGLELSEDPDVEGSHFHGERDLLTVMRIPS
jgi:hypothetical protein